MNRKDQSLSQQELASLVAASIEDVLAQAVPRIRRASVTEAARLAGAVAAGLAGLPRPRLEAIARAGIDADRAAARFVENAAMAAGLSPAASKQRRAVAAGNEQAAGEGAAEAPLVPVSEWAGPVAGPTFLEKNFAIARSTLHRWQRRNEVVALRTGGRKHVFPLAQFVDGRPASGIDRVLAIFAGARPAWLWLSRPCAALGGEMPVDVLKAEQVERVVAAARRETRR